MTRRRRGEALLPLCCVLLGFCGVCGGSKTYDEYGCCVSCGHYYCATKGKCVEEWATCDAGAGDVSGCTYSWAGLSWDLSPLKNGNPYVIQDAFSNPSENWTYVLGICEDVPSAESNTEDRCASTTGSAYETMTGVAPAYQLLDTDWDYHTCYRLGASLDSTDAEVEFGVYDPLNPAEGFYMQYKGGNACKDTVSDKAACTDEINGQTYCRRSLKINFLCNNEVTAVPSFEEIEEARGCEYELTLNSVYGCPSQCPSHKGLVCNSRGLCFYDGFEDGMTADGRSGSAQCLCEAPFSGKGCTSVDSSVESSVNWVFWLGVILICLGVGLMIGAKKEDIIVSCSGVFNLLTNYMGGHGRDKKGAYSRVKTYQYADEVMMTPSHGDDGDVNTFSL